MNATDKLMAWAQISLSFVLLALIFGSLLIYELHPLAFTDVQQKAFDSLMDWEKSIGSLVVFFWFQRLRAGGIPDAQVITQSHTAPDGTKTTITAPVNAPPASVPKLPTTGVSGPLVPTEKI
jgi:hypothetical protein